MRRMPHVALAAVAALALAARVAGAADTETRRETDDRSDIERHVSKAIAAAYLCEPRGLEEEYVYFKSLDEFLTAKRQPATGLSDDLLDLVVCSIADRDTFVTAQRRLLRETPDRDLKRRLSYRLKDEVSKADSLILTDRYNRFTFLFNTFVRPLSYFTVGYFPAFIDAGVATLLNLDRFTELSMEEKKALVLYNRFLEKYPESDQAEILRQKVTRLNRKRVKTLYRKEIKIAREMMAAERFWQAQQHFKNALAYMPDAKEASKGLEQARALEFERNRLIQKSLEPAHTAMEFRDTSDDRDYRDILYAAAGGSPEMVIYEAEDFLQRYPESSYAPYALYAIAVAHDMKGAHEKAKDILRSLADTYPQSHIARHALAYLNDPSYNLLRGFKDSLRQRGLETTRYVLLGPEFAKTNIILGTSRFVTQGLQAMATLGTFNVLAVFIRTVNMFLQNPVSEQEVIDSGLRYLRRYPDSALAPEIHLTLARAYARRKNMAKAAYHLKASGKASERQVRQMEEKAARQYLEFAGTTNSRAEKENCYNTIIEGYPRTKAAAEALEKLALIEREKKPLFEIDKKTIAQNPVLFRLSGLHLSPHLLDGNQSNGEVAPRGIYSRQRGRITVVYADGKKEREETYKVDPRTFRSLLAFADDLKYREKVDNREREGRRPRFPVELRGSVGGDGVFVYPRLKAIPYREKDQYLYQ